jgi:hypothetical protein
MKMGSENNRGKGISFMLAKEIFELGYKLNNLTYEEAKVIDPPLSEEEFEKYRI